MTEHALWVRVSHWIVTVSLLTLVFVVTHDFDDGGANGNIQHGWAWYTGI